MRLRRAAFVLLTLLLVLSVALGPACKKKEEADTGEKDQTTTQQDQPADESDTSQDDAGGQQTDDTEADGASADEASAADDQADGDDQTVSDDAEPEPAGDVSEAEMEPAVLLNELYFELASLIGQKIWVVGFFGDGSFTGDGVGFLVDNMNRLFVDERLPHHSFARLDGNMPSADWNGAEVMVYGEIKDFATEYGAFVTQPTPLITVIKYEELNPPSAPEGWENSYLISGLLSGFASFSPGVLVSFLGNTLFSQFTDLLNPQAGTQASDCDRSIIISGGIDASNNHSRYEDNVIAKRKKMKELGFSDDQIEVFYNDGSAINVDGTNIVDQKASKAKIKEHLEKLAKEMTGSCTLTIFVTDHGTGYNADQGYSGARPALSGTEATSGKLYSEKTFKMDARAKTYRSTAAIAFRGASWFFAEDATGKVKVYKRVGGKWVYKGNDADGNGTISETECGEDINGDGDSTDANYGFSVAFVKARMGAWRHNNNTWDTDGDGTNDVRLRWDGTRYVMERIKDGTWHEMGRDTDGDNDIDSSDGGVDWNLDGDKNDQVGFHEGINLWGNEVLWDDEFADMLKPLKDKGVHILIEMVACFSGGFLPNLEGIVEKIVAGSSEDTKHYNRVNAAGKVYAADEMAFLDNLKGIDIDSWNAAWDAAVKADDAAWTAAGSHAVSKNHHQRWEKPVLTGVQSAFEAEGEGVYHVHMKLDDNLKGKVYDLEIILGLQQPRWHLDPWNAFPDLPSGMSTQLIPGGVRVWSNNPFPDEFWLKIKGTEGSQKLRLQLTDKDHNALGYVIVSPGTVPPPPVTTPPAPTAPCQSCGTAAACALVCNPCTCSP